MARIINEPCHTFNEYLLIPGYTPITCRSDKVSLRTPLVKFRKGEEECPISMNIPMVSAIMQSVSGDRMAVALATEGGISFIYGSQSVEDEAAMVRRAKSYKAGFVQSDSNLHPDNTLRDVLALKEKTGHSTVAVTEDGTADGKLVGVVTSRDYRVSRMDLDTPVSTFMTPFEKLVWAREGTTLKEANDIIWEHKLNSLPILSEDGRLSCFVFRKDYESHKQNPNELLDDHKRYVALTRLKGITTGSDSRLAGSVSIMVIRSKSVQGMLWMRQVSVSLPTAVRTLLKSASAEGPSVLHVRQRASAAARQLLSSMCVQNGISILKRPVSISRSAQTAVSSMTITLRLPLLWERTS